MPAPQEQIELRDFVQMTLQALDDSGNQIARPLLMRRDRALVIWSRLVAWNGTREQVIAADPNSLLRVRPYEPIFPVEPTVLTGSLQTVYTSTGRRSELWCDVVNSGNLTGVTVLVQRLVAASAQSYDWYPSITPVATGVGIRTGFIQLEAEDELRASCNPPSAVTIHPHIHAYSESGDAP